MARNKHIRPHAITSIVSLIRGWPDEKITWEGVCAQSKPILGYLPSRGGLSAHDDIQKAFSARKGGLKQSPPPRVALPSSLAAAAHRIAAKDAEIHELKLQVDRLNQQFAIWIYNARTRLTLEQLNKPLPEIDRRHTGRRNK